MEYPKHSATENDNANAPGALPETNNAAPHSPQTESGITDTSTDTVIYELADGTGATIEIPTDLMFADDEGEYADAEQDEEPYANSSAYDTPTPSLIDKSPDSTDSIATYNSPEDNEGFEPKAGFGSDPDSSDIPGSSAQKRPTPIVAILAVVAVLAVIGVFAATALSPDPSKVDQVEPKATLNDYTWDELSKLSSAISNTNENDADTRLKIEKRYGLVDDAGKIQPDNVKTVSFADGAESSVRIIGFYHDDKSVGDTNSDAITAEGKAGITFMFTESIAQHRMTDSETNAGGWKHSECRAWLNSDELAKLDTDLSSRIVDVVKKTNNKGHAVDSDETDENYGQHPNIFLLASLEGLELDEWADLETSDKLWLLSPREIYGDLRITHDSQYDEWNDFCHQVIQLDGDPYSFFSDAEPEPDLDEELLRCSAMGTGKPVKWWLRSPSPGGESMFRAISANGKGGNDTPEKNAGRELASEQSGVVPCFCL